MSDAYFEMSLSEELFNSEQNSGDLAGQIAIVSGRLQMHEPQGIGAWPVITPGERVEIRDQGQLITKPTVVERVDTITISVMPEPPISDFALIVSRDKTKVTLRTRFGVGTEYQLQDADFTQNLTVRAEPVGEIPPQPLDPNLVIQQLEELGIKVRANIDLIVEACLGRENRDVVIARGIPAQPPVDGKVEIVCDLSPRHKNFAGSDRIDFLDKGEFNAVNAGDVLAYLHHPLAGKPGLNVFGEPIEPRKPKNPRFVAGKGVKLIRDGTVAVAEITGRPSFRNGILRVSPQLVVTEDVSISTGNVEFKGDVTVLGNVAESLTVKAGGAVEVLNNVYHAHVLAGDCITVHNKVIGGALIAGANQPGLAKARKLLRRVYKDLESLHLVCSQLKKHPKLSTSDLQVRGDGYLIKLVLETRFPNIPKTLTQVIELLGDKHESQEETSEIATAVKLVSQSFLGSGPLRMKTLAELAESQLRLGAVIENLQHLLDCPADIVIHYGQNAKIEATGSVTVTGPLVYDCDIVAGKNLIMAGECRSGSYAATASIEARSVGCTGMGHTSLSVSEDGVIKAKKFYAGVRLRVGSVQTVIEETCFNKSFFVQDGKLISHDIWQGGAKC